MPMISTLCTPHDPGASADGPGPGLAAGPGSGAGADRGASSRAWRRQRDLGRVPARCRSALLGSCADRVSAQGTSGDRGHGAHGLGLQPADRRRSRLPEFRASLAHIPLARLSSAGAAPTAGVAAFCA